MRGRGSASPVCVDRDHADIVFIAVSQSGDGITKAGSSSFIRAECTAAFSPLHRISGDLRATVIRWRGPGHKQLLIARCDNNTGRRPGSLRRRWRRWWRRRSDGLCRRTLYNIGGTTRPIIVLRYDPHVVLFAIGQSGDCVPETCCRVLVRAECTTILRPLHDVTRDL